MKKPTATKTETGKATSDPSRYRLRFYISGATPRSTQAIANIKEIGETCLHGRSDLEVIHAYQQAALVRDQQIVVLPTLIRHLPLTVRRLIGDLSDGEQVLVGAGIVPDEESGTDLLKDGVDARSR